MCPRWKQEPTLSAFPRMTCLQRKAVCSRTFSLFLSRFHFRAARVLINEETSFTTAKTVAFLIIANKYA